MVGVYLDLPFCCDTLHLGMFKTELNHFFDEGIHKKMVIEAEDFPGYGGDTVNDSATVLVPGGAFFQKCKQGDKKILKAFRLFFSKNKSQTAVNLP